MKTWMLAPIALLLSGASALPALAQDPGRYGRGEPGDLRSPSAQPVESADWQDNGRARPGEGGTLDFGPDQDGHQAWIARESRRDERRDRRREDQRRRDQDGQRYQQRFESRYEDRYEDRHEDRREARSGARYDTRDRYDVRYDARYDDRRDTRYYVRHDDRRWRGNYWYPQYRYRAPVRYVPPYGYRPYAWRVGHRLPTAYYQPSYYVDYRGYQLPPPPFGYHWVRVDRDVVLVSLASGLIQDILYGLYY